MYWNLEKMELRIVTAALLRMSRDSSADNMKPDDMEMRDHFLVFLRNSKCNLVFEKIRVLNIQMVLCNCIKRHALNMNVAHHRTSNLLSRARTGGKWTLPFCR